MVQWSSLRGDHGLHSGFGLQLLSLWSLDSCMTLTADGNSMLPPKYCTKSETYDSEIFEILGCSKTTRISFLEGKGHCVRLDVPLKPLNLEPESQAAFFSRISGPTVTVTAKVTNCTNEGTCLKAGIHPTLRDSAESMNV